MVATLEFEVVKWAYALITHKWLPKVYIDLYVVAILEGGVLIDNTSFGTSSRAHNAFVITLVNHCSNGSNFAMVVK